MAQGYGAKNIQIKCTYDNPVVDQRIVLEETGK